MTLRSALSWCRRNAIALIGSVGAISVSLTLYQCDRVQRIPKLHISGYHTDDTEDCDATSSDVHRFFWAFSNTRFRIKISNARNIPVFLSRPRAMSLVCKPPCSGIEFTPYVGDVSSSTTPPSGFDVSIEIPPNGICYINVDVYFVLDVTTQEAADFMRALYSEGTNLANTSGWSPSEIKARTMTYGSEFGDINLFHAGLLSVHEATVFQHIRFYFTDHSGREHRSERLDF